MQNYLSGLNERQLEAVLHKDGPLMIVAGAGSGKTKVLTTRIAHLMAHHHVDAFNILALTFTNKAAKEMKERVEHILGNSNARNLYIGTFHSVFARVLRSEAEKLGYPSSFTIYDTDDAKSVIKTVVNELNLDDKHYKPNTIYNRISSAKNSLITAEEYANDFSLQQEDIRANRPAFSKIYLAYTQRCFRNGAMDFDDLLLNMYKLLKNFPEALYKYQHKFKYILIDEYQDTNTAQYEIIKLLGAAHENICVVGDDAQSIYSFRGATIQNILRFQHDYEEVKVVKLEQNYRSTQNIIEAANHVIKNNKEQIPKSLWTSNIAGEKIKIVRTMTDNDEGKFVADTIQEQKLRNHYRHNDFAILYRTNAQSRAFEESLRKMNIPYIIYGGISFYQRKEIKDFVAYLRLVVNHNDEEALKRIINYPVRGIGKTSIDRLVLAANTHNITMWEVLKNAAQFGFKGATLEAINNFVLMIDGATSMLQTHNAYDIAMHLGKQTNIIKELFSDKTVEGIARYENVQELLNSIKEFIETPSNEFGEVGDKSLAAYLQQISLHTDADEKDPNSDTVKLMTIHAAKGLEFKCVFACGLEENLFPSALSINTREELEEERRLFYVVITRAKEKLWISYSTSRYKFGHLEYNEPSRFINELPEEFLDRSQEGSMMGQSRNFFGYGNYDNQVFGRSSYGRRSDSNSAARAEKRYGPPPRPQAPQYITPSASPKPVDHTPSPNFVAHEASEFREGHKVEHQKFGFGEIVKIEGSAHNPIATIRFEKNGEKKIMLKYAKLMILNL